MKLKPNRFYVTRGGQKIYINPDVISYGIFIDYVLKDYGVIKKYYAAKTK
jgi:hypothetical protein